MQPTEANDRVKPSKSDTKLDSLKPLPSKAKVLNPLIDSVLPCLPIGGGGPLTPTLPVTSVPYHPGTIFGPIALDYGLSLEIARNPRSLDRGKEFPHKGPVSELLQQLKISLGLERFHKKIYAAALSMIVANLLEANAMGAELLVPRNTWYTKDLERNPGEIKPTQINRVCEFLADQGHIKYVPGRANEYQGVQTWASALPPLIEKFGQNERLVRWHPRKPLAVIRDSDKMALPPPRSGRKRRLLERQAGPAKRHNLTWNTHEARLDGIYIPPWLYRIFNESLDYGGRFHAPYQHLPSETRRLILIDGEPTVELDYKAIHFNIMYAWEGVPFVGDPYQVEGYERKTIKAVSVRFVNVDNIASFQACITRSGNPEVIEAHRDYIQRRAEHDALRANGHWEKPPFKPKCLEGFIQGIPPGTQGEDVIAQLCFKHMIIQHHFGRPKIGVTLQRWDSAIMARALDILEGVPTLPVHDSIRCRASDQEQVKEAMLQAYYDEMGQTIQVELK